MPDAKVRCACGEWHYRQAQGWLIARHGGLWEEVNGPAVNGAVQLTEAPKKRRGKTSGKKRGEYPNTDARREYMRKKMAERRAKGLA